MTEFAVKACWTVGRPTSHVKFGHRVVIAVGDAFRRNTSRRPSYSRDGHRGGRWHHEADFWECEPARRAAGIRCERSGRQAKRAAHRQREQPADARRAAGRHGEPATTDGLLVKRSAVPMGDGRMSRSFLRSADRWPSTRPRPQSRPPASMPWSPVRVVMRPHSASCTTRTCRRSTASSPAGSRIAPWRKTSRRRPSSARSELSAAGTS